MAPPKVSMDRAAEYHSLSFSGLLSVQDMQSKAPYMTPGSATRNSDASISNGQVQLQALLYESKGATNSNNNGKTRKSTNDSNNSIEVSNKPNHRKRNQAKNEHVASNKSFG